MSSYDDAVDEIPEDQGPPTYLAGPQQSLPAPTPVSANSNLPPEILDKLPPTPQPQLAMPNALGNTPPPIDNANRLPAPPVSPIQSKMTETISGQKISPELQAEQAAGYIRGKQNIDFQTNDLRNQASDTKDAIAERNRQLDLNQQQYNAQQSDSKEDQQAAADKIQKDIQDLKTQKIDSNQYWTQSPGKSALRLIGLALGTFGSSYNKTPNTAAEIVSKGIEDNIKAQQQEYENKKEGVNLENNAYAQLRQRGADQLQATLGARQLLIEQSKGKIDEVGAKYSSPLIQDNANILKNDLDHQETMTRINQYLASQPKTITKTEEGTGKPNLENQLKIQGLQVVHPDTGKIGTVTVGSENDAEKLRTASQALRKEEMITNEMKQIAGRHKLLGPAPGTEDAGRLHALHKALTETMKDLEGSGNRVNPADAPYITSIPDAGDFVTNPSNQIQYINGLQDRTRNDFNANLEQHKVKF